MSKPPTVIIVGGDPPTQTMLLKALAEHNGTCILVREHGLNMGELSAKIKDHFDPRTERNYDKYPVHSLQHHLHH